jgi:hypothetical protein
MKIRVYAENVGDGERQEVVGYVEAGETRTLETVVQQADPEAAARAVAAVIAVGLHAAAHVDPLLVERELGLYGDALDRAARAIAA